MTKFDSFIRKLDYETFAKMLVKICVINNSELYYVTSYGQLYPYTKEGYNNAVLHETQYWAQEMCVDTNNCDTVNAKNREEISGQIKLEGM